MDWRIWGAIAAVCALGAAGCKGPTTLVRGADAIRAVEPTAAADCEKLGDYSKRNTSTWQDPAEAREDALNKALNQAAEWGATHVALSEFYNSVGGACSDCAEIDATAYRCDGPVDDTTVAEVVAPAATPTPSGDATVVDESNHADHDAVCAEVDDREPGQECTFDTECLVCQDGEGCGRAVTRATFVAEAASCAKASGESCTAQTAFCCAGHCVLAE